MQINPFTQHPSCMGETYVQHMRSALFYSFKLLYASFAAFVHAFCPFLFQSTASRIATEIYENKLKRVADSSGNGAEKCKTQVFFGEQYFSDDIQKNVGSMPPMQGYIGPYKPPSDISNIRVWPL